VNCSSVQQWRWCISTWQMCIDVQIAVIYVFGPQMFNSSVQSSKNSYSQSVLKMSASCFSACSIAIVWWQSRWQTDPAAGVLQLHILTAHQCLESSLCTPFLASLPIFCQETFKQAFCFIYLVLLTTIWSNTFFHANRAIQCLSEKTQCTGFLFPQLVKKH